VIRATENVLRHDAQHTFILQKCLFIHSLTHSKKSSLRETVLKRMASTIFYQQIWSPEKDFGNGDWRV
jgi:hypothetical protein